jgi:predicted transcriptional regulator
MSPPVTACMTREVFGFAPETSLEVAGRLLYSKHITGAPVLDRDGQPVGVVTAKDLVDPDRRRSPERGTATVYRLTADGRDQLDGGKVASPGRVADVMTRYVIAVGPEATIQQAMKLMTCDDIHRVLVIGAAKRIIGIVSSMDILRALLSSAPT